MNTIKLLIKSLCAVALIAVFTGCSQEGIDVRPGLWTELDVIETFPGDTVFVTGQVSNYVGMRSVEIKCDAWNIAHTYSLDGKHAKVFNLNYPLIVPEDATFDQVLLVTVTDTEGSENKKAITLTFKPDTEAPQVTSQFPEEVSVEFDQSTGTGIYHFNATLSDDRALQMANISIPAIGYNENIPLSGRTALVMRDITINTQGNLPMTLTVIDETGNVLTREVTLVVMGGEVEDPVSDYSVMWMVNASENPDDYLDGYYAPMIRQGAYQYQGSFYADKNGYQIYIVPEKSMDGDIFGVSPYVSSKLMNKRGYVVPITIEKAGYYGMWIDLQAHTWSIWDLDVSAAYTGSMSFAGSGFADWGVDAWGNMTDEMPRNGYRYTYTVKQNGNQSTHYYYAARVSDWGWVMRYWSDSSGCGWWIDDAGYGGSVGSYESTYEGNVLVTFDTAIPWATVKKAGVSYSRKRR